MKSIIEGMYHGTFRPLGEVHMQSAERTERIKKILNAGQDFVEQFPECRTAFEKYLAECAEFDSADAYEQFLLGFRTGAQLMLEMLRPIE